MDKDTAIQIDKTDKTAKTPAQCIELINSDVVKIQTTDGSWIDSRVGCHYGTSIALLILSGQKVVSEGKK
jgi:hypothetical protein